MSKYEKFIIYLKESEDSYNFKYFYNKDSTFYDLLESFSYNYPNLKICPCYKIEYYNSYYSNENEKINMTDKICKSISSYHKYQLFKENNECTCDEFIKDYFVKPKVEIIQKLSEYSEEVYKLRNEIKENKSMNNELFK